MDSGKNISKLCYLLAILFQKDISHDRYKCYASWAPELLELELFTNIWHKVGKVTKPHGEAEAGLSVLCSPASSW